MTSMRERIGAAVAAHFGDEDGHHPVYDGIVDAILEAMEEPTPEMIASAEQAGGHDDHRASVIPIWRAMISEARKG